MSETKERKTPTESQILVTMSDWLGSLRQNKDGAFTHRGKGGIDRTHKNGISSYLIDETEGIENMELIRQSRMAAQHLVNSILHEQAEISVGGRDSMHGKVEGRHHINLATDYFDDSRLTGRQKADILLGLASHEAAHGAYTDGSLTTEALDKENPDFRTLKKEIWNIIEDERIEYHLGDQNPGLAGLLGETKRYYFDRLIRDMTDEGREAMPTEPLPRLLATLTQAVRYPSEMTRESVEEHFDELDTIRKILTPYPLNPEAAWQATERIMDVVKDLAKEQAQQKKEQQSGANPQQSPDGGQSGQQQSGDASGQDQQEGNPEEQQSDGTPQQQNPQEGKSGRAKRKSGPTKKEIERELKAMLGTDQAKRVLDAISKDAAKAQNGRPSRDLRSDTVLRYVNEDDAESAGGGPGDPRSFIFKPKGDRARYTQTLAKVQRFIPAMSKVLACKSRESVYCLHGQPSGRLNTSRLVAFRAGNTHIFDKEGSVSCSSASIILLIDESGSMSGERMQAAREAAVLVNEAIRRIDNVNYYCYGYTDNEITVYSEDRRISRWALSDTRAEGGTPTGRAMKVVADRVRGLTRDPAIMLVLTDGHPDSNNEVVQQDKELRKRDIHPIGVGIQTEAVSAGFSEYVVMQDISTLALAIGRITKNRINRMLVRTDSLA